MLLLKAISPSPADHLNSADSRTFKLTRQCLDHSNFQKLQIPLQITEILLEKIYNFIRGMIIRVVLSVVGYRGTASDRISHWQMITCSFSNALNIQKLNLFKSTDRGHLFGFFSFRFLHDVLVLVSARPVQRERTNQRGKHGQNENGPFALER